VKRLLALLVVVGLAVGLVGCTSSPTTGGGKPPTAGGGKTPPLPTDGKHTTPTGHMETPKHETPKAETPKGETPKGKESKKD
jgi:hypothetical protein